MITPTIGRKVWFYPSEHDKAGAEGMRQYTKETPLDATVTYVHGARMVNLFIVDHEGRTFRRTSVTLVQPEEKPPVGYYCTWMPFQVGQAAQSSASGQNVVTS